jgi:hypothetical protein
LRISPGLAAAIDPVVGDWGIVPSGPDRIPADAAPNGWKLPDSEVDNGIDRARGDSISGRRADLAAGETKPGMLSETVLVSVNVPLMAR